MTFAILSACSEPAPAALPAFHEIMQATEGYAGCVYDAARELATDSGKVDTLAQQAVDRCRESRSQALALKSVPVAFPTISEFDTVHLGLARGAIEKARSAN
jgi:hypothetical protein